MSAMEGSCDKSRLSVEVEDSPPPYTSTEQGPAASVEPMGGKLPVTEGRSISPPPYSPPPDSRRVMNVAVTLMIVSIVCVNPIAIVLAVMALVYALAYKRKVIHVMGYSSCTPPAEEEILIPKDSRLVT